MLSVSKGTRCPSPSTASLTRSAKCLVWPRSPTQRAGRWLVTAVGKSAVFQSDRQLTMPRWIEHYDLDPAREKELIKEGVKIFQSLSPDVRHKQSFV